MGTHDLRVRLADIAAQQGRCKEAIHLYAQVLEGNPYQPEAWHGLSRVVADPERAAYCRQRLLALSPDYPHANDLPWAIYHQTPSDPPETAVSNIVQHWPGRSRP